MSWTGYTYNRFLNPLGRGRRGSRLLRGIGRGARRAMRSARPRRYGRGCCCCPAVFLLGLASLGLLAGGFYLGVRLLGWA